MKEFLKTIDNVCDAIKTLPERVATLAVNFSKERFSQQNWMDESAEAWAPRKRARRGGKRRQAGAILVDSGRLKRSIRKLSVSKERIVIGTDVEYAEAHNEGYDGIVSVRPHTRTRNGNTHNVRGHSRHAKTEQRRFLGESAELAKRIEDLIQTEIEKAIKK